MGRMQTIRPEDMAASEAAIRGLLVTRDETVRREGALAARRGMTSHDNPYRSQSADGVAWRRGFDDAAQA